MRMFENPGQKCRCLLRILFIDGSKFRHDLTLFAMSQPHIHGDKNRKHHKCWKRWPFQKESQHDQDESPVLRVTHMRIWSGCRECVSLLCFVQDTPGRREKNESPKDEDAARDMEYIEMGISFQTQERMPQMTGIVAV